MSTNSYPVCYTSDSQCLNSSLQVDARLIEEEFRTCKYLHATSVEKVMSVCQDKLVKSQLHLLQSECHDMIHKEKLAGMAFLCAFSTVMSCHDAIDFPLEVCLCRELAFPNLSLSSVAWKCYKDCWSFVDVFRYCQNMSSTWLKDDLSVVDK